MKAVFEVTSITNSWKPPFRKEKNISEYTAGEGTCFEEVNSNNVSGTVFRLKEIREGRALVEYDSHFMRKDMPNSRDKEVWMEKGKTYEFSFLWGDNGITKKVSLKKVVSDD